MKTKFDLLQWALANLPLAVAALILAGGLAYILKFILADNKALRAERDSLLKDHAKEIKDLTVTHALEIQGKTQELQRVVDRYHGMAEKNITVLDSLDRTIDDCNALPYLKEAIPPIQAAVASIGAEMGLKPHQMRG